MIPKTYIKRSYEHREGFEYKQPVEYCNDVRLTFDVIKDFKNIFGVSLSQAVKESSSYNRALESCKYDSELWNEKQRDKALLKIHNSISNSNCLSSITPLFPFEIYMMNDGFEMISFCGLNAIDPGFSIVAKSQIGDNILNPQGIKYGRCYKKDNHFISLGFGIEINDIKTNFYFNISKSNSYFQVDNNINNYHKAINGNLKSL